MPRKLARRTAPPSEPEPEETPAEETTTEEWRPEPLLFDVGDACFMLGKISKQMLYRLIHDELITPVKVGTRSMFTRAELERFVDQRIKDGAE